MSQQLDTQGEAHDALGSAVNSYGQRVLNDPHILGNLVTDLLPDLPRERNLLVTGAEAGVAAEITQHVEEQHIDPDTAVQLVARTLSERRAIDPAASMWVASEYAQALGYQVRPYGEAGQAPQPQVTPAVPPTMTALSGQPMSGQPLTGPPLTGSPMPTTPPPSQEPVTQEPRWQGAETPQLASGTQPPQGPPPWPWNAQQQGQSWPPPTQPGPVGPPPPGNRRKIGIITGGTIAGLVVIFLIIAAVAGIAPFSKSAKNAAAPTLPPTHSATPTKPAHSPTPTPTPTPTLTLAAGVTPLIQLLPQDIADPTTQCSTVTKPDWTSPGLVYGYSCTDPNVPNGQVSAYQMDNLTDYNATWKNFNTWSSFDTSTAGTACPPSGAGTQGITPWNSKAGFPSMQGQVLECWTGSNAAPIYVWTLPTQDAFIVAIGANGSTFKALNSWWTSSNSSPENVPPTPKPQSS
jgi:hypothetical protein